MIELVPNFSEGRRPEVVRAIRDAMAAVEGVTVLDVSSDTSHNRTVVTLVAPHDRAVDAAFAGIRTASQLIDLTTHQGEHPRLGATDVVPFVPLDGNTMDECVALARTLGARVATELGIPVYLYERAATRPERQNLADIRRGEFEGLRDTIATDAARVPDFGAPNIHPTAGAVVIGARPFLVAYNVYLGPVDNLQVAKAVAKAVRQSSGGLPGVKGLGMEVDGQAQVSMNLVDTERTPLHRAYEAVKAEAASRGASATWSEIVGLVPERVLFDAAASYLQLRHFTPDLVLETQVRKATSRGETLDGFIAAVASNKPVPGGGSVSAHVGALGAALAQMVAGLTIGRKKYVAVEASMKNVASRAAELTTQLSELVQRDADSYASVSAAYKLPQDTDATKASRAAAIEAALVGASTVPLETSRACADVAELALIVAQDGNTNAVSDGGVAVLLAEAAAKGAGYNVRINAKEMTNRSVAEKLIDDARHAVDRASAAARRVEERLATVLNA